MSNSFGLDKTLLSEIRTLADKYHIRRVILFGSRARGDYHAHSDIDLAVEGSNFQDFTFDTDETTSTLLKFDFVNLNNKISDELKTAIKTDGRIIYEKI